MDKWPSRMLGQWFFEIGWASNRFRSGIKNLGSLAGRLPLPKYSSPPQKSLWGGGNLISSMRRGEFKPTKPKGSVMGIKRGSIHGMQGDSSTPKPSGIMKVTILDFDLAGVQYPTISCWF